MKINKKSWISTGQSVYRGVQFVWPLKCGAGSESLNKKGKDFDDNVEAHESTCNTWPTS